MRESLSLLYIGIILLCSCRSDSALPTTSDFQKFSGETMGTYYAITCAGGNQRLQSNIDNILVQFNKELSTYDPQSYISKFNSSSTGISFKDKEETFDSFLKNIAASKRIHAQTEGAFDPSLMPVINYWGFGYNGRRVVNRIDSAVIDSLMLFVGMDRIKVDSLEKAIIKERPGTQLDFSAIAKGYGVDLICLYLDSLGITDYLVDIGGESKAKGQNPRKKTWTLGINTPDIGASYTEAMFLINLDDAALATSGNYRNFHKREDGSIYSHTIDAMTGYPAKTDILSASVIAKDCMMADALATSFMVMGLAKSKEKLVHMTAIEALFIYANETGGLEMWHSDGFDKYLVK